MITINYSYPLKPQQRFESGADSIIIGRSIQNQPVDLDLTPDVTISRRHARLAYENGSYWLEDLGSKSGTWVNEQKVTTKIRLMPGDEVRLGQTTLQISWEILSPSTGKLYKAQPPTIDMSITRKYDAVEDGITESQILEKVASTLNLEEVLKRIVEAAVHLSRADEGALLLLDEETNELFLRAAKDLGEKYARTLRQPVSDYHLARQVILTGEPILSSPGDPVKVKTDYFVKSALNLPIKRGELTYGVLAVYNSTNQRTFTHRHLALLTPLANYAAIAIENALVFHKTSQLLNEAYALFELFEVVGFFNETRDLEDLLHLIASLAIGRFESADRVVIHLLDAQTGRLERKVRIPPVADRSEEPRGFAIGEGIAGRMLQENHPINIPNVNDEKLYDVHDMASGALLVAPISIRTVSIGTISVASPKENAFKRRDENLLAFFAHLGGIAIENARLFEAERTRAAQLMVVAQLAEKLTSILDLDELLQETVTLIHATFGFEDVAIKLLDEQAGGLIFKVAAGLHAANFRPDQIQKLGEGIIGWVAQTGRTAFSNDVSQDARYIDLWVCETKSELAVPLKYRDGVIGVLDVQTQSLDTFGAHNVLAMEALADQIAVAIENARLYTRQAQLFKESQERLEVVERRNRELHSLRDILGALQSTLSLPQVLAHITDGVVKGLNYRAVMLSTIDETTQLLTVQEFSMEAEVAMQGLLDQGERLAGQKLVGNSASLEHQQDNMGVQVCLDGRVRVTHNLHDILRPIVSEPLSRLIQNMLQLTTFAVLPIKSDRRLFGVLYAGTRNPEISEADLEALQAFASQGYLAIQNARQFEDIHERLRRRVRELQGLQDIDRLISSTSDLDMMLKNILDLGLKLVSAESGNIVLADSETGNLIPQVSYPEETRPMERYEPGLTAWVAKERKTAREKDLAQSPWANTYRGTDIRSELASPILVGDELVGVITMGSAKSDAFTEEDESLLEILATQTAVAIQTARYYQELEKSRLQSLETERIAAMSDIAGNMVHSINNSTGAIRVLVQQIQQKMTQEALTPEFLAKKLEAISMSAEKTLEMARNIRSPFQQMAVELVDVNACIKAALRDFEPLPQTVRLVLNLNQNLPAVMATQQLEKVFWNLISNAIEAMGGSGTLRIASRQAGPVLEVAIRDSGPGIPRELTEPDIFKLGVSSKKDGLGYGLWWCRIYLNRVNGSIRLDPGVTSGCRFVVRLQLPGS